jgi:hypothetical protein
MLHTIEARLDTKIEASTAGVEERLTARLNDAIKMFEGHIKAKRQTELATKVNPTPPVAPPIPDTQKGVAPQPTKSHNIIDLRAQEDEADSARELNTTEKGEVQYTGVVKKLTDNPESSRQ